MLQEADNRPILQIPLRWDQGFSISLAIHVIASFSNKRERKEIFTKNERDFVAE